MATNAVLVVRRAFSEFLAVPSGIILSFLLLAGGTFVLDKSASPWLHDVKAPLSGILTIYSLRDLLARWSAEDAEAADRRGQDDADAAVPIVYPDHISATLMNAFETLAVVASESMQHQSLIAVLEALSSAFDRQTTALAGRAEDVILRVLPSLGDYVLTSQLDEALAGVADRLSRAGRETAAVAVDAARRQLGQTVGTLGSRSTRAAGPPWPGGR